MAKAAKIKTAETMASVDDFVDQIKDDQKKKDTHSIMKMLEKATKQKPKMWGSAIIGYGNVRYKSPTSGREVDWMRIGFSPRKANFSIYFTSGLDKHSDALKKIGKHKAGMGCLYINKLEDIDVKILEKMIQAELNSDKKK